MKDSYFYFYFYFYRPAIALLAHAAGCCNVSVSDNEWVERISVLMTRSHR